MLRLFIAAVVLLSCSHHVSAQTMRLVTGNGLEPYTGIDLPNGGLITAVVAAVYADMGFDVEIQFGDWERGYGDTLAGQFEATFPYQPDQVKTDDFYLSSALERTQVSIFVSSDSQNRFWTLRDLPGQNYCVPRNYRSNKVVDALMASNAEMLMRAQTMRDCMRQLADGSVAFVPAYDLLGFYSALNALDANEGVSALAEPYGLGTFHLLIPKSQPNAVAHLQNFNRSLRRLEAQGDIRLIRQRYISGLQTQQPE